MDHGKGEDCNAFPYDLSFYDLSESINGLICLNGPKPRFCNLSTRESVTLPPSRLSLPESCFSLGFDSCSNIYKILKASITYQPGSCVCEILTLGSKTWRAVTVDSYYFPVLKYLRSICVRGSLYWDHALLDEIVAFGLAEERFRLVPPPAGVPQYSSLAQLDGRLAMVNYKGLISGDTIPMWVLEDDQNGVWSMKQRIVFSSILNDARLGLQGIPPKYFHTVETTHAGALECGRIYAALQFRPEKLQGPIILETKGAWSAVMDSNCHQLCGESCTIERNYELLQILKLALKFLQKYH